MVFTKISLMISASATGSGLILSRFYRLLTFVFFFFVFADNFLTRLIKLSLSSFESLLNGAFESNYF